MATNDLTLDQLTAAQKRQIMNLKRPIMDAARSFGAVREKLTALAPKMVQAFNSITAEHPSFTFVQYVRLFDPTVPTHAVDRDGVTGYRNHRTYYTMQYMRRLVQAQGTRRGQQGVRDSAADALARTLATVLQVVEDRERIWTAIQQEFGYSERLMTRLRKRVEDTQPLIRLEVQKPAKIGKLIHMERTEPMQQPGQNVEIPAERGRKRAA